MNENKKNEVILIGLPNSGKSTLINTLTNKKNSIIGSEPNTTRDKISTVIEINNKQLTLSDLPGFDENPDNFNKVFQDNFQHLLKDAGRVLFVIDVNSKNFTGLDKINNLLQINNVEDKVTTVFNKCENFNEYDLDKRMFKYIYGREIYISGFHKIGTDELLDDLIKYSGVEKSGDLNSKNAISIIGKPNSGKSTLFNAFLEKERSIVSDIPGTTRDSIIEEVIFDDKVFNILDTAGVPRKKQKDQIDRYASDLSIKTLNHSLISFVVVDSSQGINFEDMRLINESIENEQREIEVRLNKIEDLKPLLQSRKYGQKWEDLEFGISAQSLIERVDAPLADSLKLNSGYWEKIEKAEKSRFKYFDEIDKNIEKLTQKRFSNF